MLLLFPGGLLLTPRWWAVGWAAAGLGTISVVLIWLAPTPITVDGLPSLPNPTALRGSIRIPATGPFGGGTWVLEWGVPAAGRGELVRQVPSVGR